MKKRSGDYKKYKASLRDGFVPVAKLLSIAIDFLHDIHHRQIVDKIARSSYGTWDKNTNKQREYARLSVRDLSLTYNISAKDIYDILEELSASHVLVIEPEMLDSKNKYKLFNIKINEHINHWQLKDFNAEEVQRIYNREILEYRNRQYLTQLDRPTVRYKYMEAIKNVFLSDKFDFNSEISNYYKTHVELFNALDNKQEFIKKLRNLTGAHEKVARKLDCGIRRIILDDSINDDYEHVRAWFLSHIEPEAKQTTPVRTNSNKIDRLLAERFNTTNKQELAFLNAIFYSWCWLQRLHNIPTSKIIDNDKLLSYCKDKAEDRYKPLNPDGVELSEYWLNIKFDDLTERLTSRDVMASFAKMLAFAGDCNIIKATKHDVATLSNSDKSTTIPLGCLPRVGSGRYSGAIKIAVNDNVDGNVTRKIADAVRVAATRASNVNVGAGRPPKRAKSGAETTGGTLSPFVGVVHVVAENLKTGQNSLLFEAQQQEGQKTSVAVLEVSNKTPASNEDLQASHKKEFLEKNSSLTRARRTELWIFLGEGGEQFKVEKFLSGGEFLSGVQGVLLSESTQQERTSEASEPYEPRPPKFKRTLVQWANEYRIADFGTVVERPVSSHLAAPHAASVVEKVAEPVQKSEASETPVIGLETDSSVFNLDSLPDPVEDIEEIQRYKEAQQEEVDWEKYIPKNKSLDEAREKFNKVLENKKADFFVKGTPPDGFEQMRRELQAYIDSKVAERAASRRSMGDTTQTLGRIESAPGEPLMQEELTDYVKAGIKLNQHNTGEKKLSDEELAEVNAELAPVAFNVVEHKEDELGLKGNETEKDGFYRMIAEEFDDPCLSDFILPFFDYKLIDRFLHLYSRVPFYYHRSESKIFDTWLSGFKAHIKCVRGLYYQYGLKRVKDKYEDIYLTDIKGLKNEHETLDTFCKKLAKYLDDNAPAVSYVESVFSLGDPWQHMNTELMRAEALATENKEEQYLLYDLLKLRSGALMETRANFKLKFRDGTKNKADLTNMPKESLEDRRVLEFCLETALGNYIFLMSDATRYTLFTSWFNGNIKYSHFKQIAEFYTLMKEKNIFDLPAEYYPDKFPMLKNEMAVKQACEKIKAMQPNRE